MIYLLTIVSGLLKFAYKHIRRILDNRQNFFQLRRAKRWRQKGASFLPLVISYSKQVWFKWRITSDEFWSVSKLLEIFDENVLQHFWISYGDHRTSSHVHFVNFAVFLGIFNKRFVQTAIFFEVALYGHIGRPQSDFQSMAKIWVLGGGHGLTERTPKHQASKEALL